MTKKLVCKTGTFTDRGGNNKNRWTNIGVMMENDKGFYILLDATVSLSGILALQNQMTGESRGNIMVSVFDDDGQKKPQQQQQSQQKDDFDDESPF